jgi:transcriptional regulator with XRE-family HTH domain
MSPRSRKRRGPRGAFADALRAARTTRGLTQQQAAQSLDVERSWLAALESGTRKPGAFARRVLDQWIRESKKGDRDGRA